MPELKMPQINNIIVSGRIVRDPELKHSQAGKAYVKTAMAIDKGFGDNKIQVIKAVRSLTNLALKEAKQVVEGVPSNIQEGVSKEDGDKAVAALKEAGAEAELKPHAG